MKRLPGLKTSGYAEIGRAGQMKTLLFENAVAGTGVLVVAV